MKKDIFYTILILALLLNILYACSPGSNSFKNVSAVQAEKILSKKKNIVIIDVRTPPEYATLHLEGAINIDVQSEDFEKRIDSLNRNSTYLIYCRSGYRSSKAMSKMRQNNFLHLINMKDGIIACKDLHIR